VRHFLRDQLSTSDTDAFNKTDNLLSCAIIAKTYGEAPHHVNEITLKASAAKQLDETMTLIDRDIYQRIEHYEVQDWLNHLRRPQHRLTSSKDGGRDLEFRLSDVVLKIGDGGIHSNQFEFNYTVAEDEILLETDQSSAYPSSISEYEIVPKHLHDIDQGASYLAQLRSYAQLRKEAKASGNQLANEAYKLLANTTTGAIGQKQSSLAFHRHDRTT